MAQSKMTAFWNALKFTYGFEKRDSYFAKHNELEITSKSVDNEIRIFITFRVGGNAALDEIMLLIQAMKMDFLITVKENKVQIEIY